jgi:hypothetical protein
MGSISLAPSPLVLPWMTSEQKEYIELHTTDLIESKKETAEKAMTTVSSSFGTLPIPIRIIAVLIVVVVLWYVLPIVIFCIKHVVVNMPEETFSLILLTVIVVVIWNMWVVRL